MRDFDIAGNSGTGIVVALMILTSPIWLPFYIMGYMARLVGVPRI